MKQNITILYRRWYRNTHRHINKQQRRHLKGYFRASVRDCTFVLLQVHLGPIESLSYSCWTTYLWRFIWRMSMGHSASLSDILHVLCQKGCLLSGFFCACEYFWDSGTCVWKMSHVKGHERSLHRNIYLDENKTRQYPVVKSSVNVASVCTKTQ